MEDSMSYELSSEVTHHHFQNSPLVTEISSIHCGRGLCKQHEYQEAGICGAIFEADYHILPFCLQLFTSLSDIKRIHFHLRSSMSQLIASV